jgi:hypothetical protein
LITIDLKINKINVKIIVDTEYPKRYYVVKEEKKTNNKQRRLKMKNIAVSRRYSALMFFRVAKKLMPWKQAYWSVVFRYGYSNKEKFAFANLSNNTQRILADIH